MQSNSNLWDVTTSELTLKLDAHKAADCFAVFCFNVGDAKKHALADFMIQLAQTGKVVSLAQLKDNRVYMMVRRGVSPGEASARLEGAELLPFAVPWAEVEDYVVLRLLFNSCSQPMAAIDDVPNDTGRLFSVSAAYRTKLETVETIVRPDCSVEQRIRTFTKRSVLLGRAKGDEREREKIKSQVGYSLSLAGTVVLAAKGDRDEFILRRARGDRPTSRRDATFSSDAEAVARTKKGIFYRLLRTLDRRYGSFAEIGFKRYPRTGFYEVLKSGQYKAMIGHAVAGRDIVVSFAHNGLAGAARELVSLVNASDWGVCAIYGGRHVDKCMWNIVVVPDDVSAHDGYALHEGVIEQHISASVCRAATKELAILGNVLKELLAKQDVVDRTLTAFELGACGIDSIETCGVVGVPCKQGDEVEIVKRLATLRMSAGGRMTYRSHAANDGPEGDLEFDLIDDEGKLDSGIYTFNVVAGDRSMTARIRDTGLVTFPNDFITFVPERQLRGAGRKVPILETYYSPYYGIGTFERNGRACYFVGVDKGVNVNMPTAVHVREIEVLEGDDLSDALVRLTNIGLARFGRPSMWPISVKYLNEFALREGVHEC